MYDEERKEVDGKRIRTRGRGLKRRKEECKGRVGRGERGRKTET